MPCVLRSADRWGEEEKEDVLREVLEGLEGTPAGMIKYESPLPLE